MGTLARALRAAVYGTAFLLLWAWAALATRRLDPVLGLRLPPGARPAGAALLAAGGALALACASLFVVRGRGTPAPFDPPRRFVAEGPYRWARNPMYLGGLAMLTGFGLWHRSAGMLLFAGAAAVLVHLFVVRFEEPRLKRRFGRDYRRYLKSVNRWVPRPPGPPSGRSPR